MKFVTGEGQRAPARTGCGGAERLVPSLCRPPTTEQFRRQVKGACNSQVGLFDIRHRELTLWWLQAHRDAFERQRPVRQLGRNYACAVCEFILLEAQVGLLLFLPLVVSASASVQLFASIARG